MDQILKIKDKILKNCHTWPQARWGHVPHWRDKPSFSISPVSFSTKVGKGFPGLHIYQFYHPTGSSSLAFPASISYQWNLRGDPSTSSSPDPQHSALCQTQKLSVFRKIAVGWHLCILHLLQGLSETTAWESRNHRCHARRWDLTQKHHLKLYSLWSLAIRIRKRNLNLSHVQTLALIFCILWKISSVNSYLEICFVFLWGCGGGLPNKWTWENLRARF